MLRESGLVVPDYLDIIGRVRPIRHSNEFWDHYGVLVHPELRQPGDLIFESRNGYYPTHIGIVRDQESYIHSLGKDDTKVKISKIIQQPIVTTRQMDYRKTLSHNPIGYKSPVLPRMPATYRYSQVTL